MHGSLTQRNVGRDSAGFLSYTNARSDGFPGWSTLSSSLQFYLTVLQSGYHLSLFVVELEIKLYSHSTRRAQICLLRSVKQHQHEKGGYFMKIRTRLFELFC